MVKNLVTYLQENFNLVEVVTGTPRVDSFLFLPCSGYHGADFKFPDPGCSGPRSGCQPGDSFCLVESHCLHAGCHSANQAVISSAEIERVRDGLLSLIAYVLELLLLVMALMPWAKLRSISLTWALTFTPRMGISGCIRQKEVRFCGYLLLRGISSRLCE